VLHDALCEHGRRWEVKITTEIGREGLLSGDVGTVVHIHGNAAAYEVEFATLTGNTIAVATVLPTQSRPIGHRDINHGRLIMIGL
jgi:hypothetical protein